MRRLAATFGLLAVLAPPAAAAVNVSASGWRVTIEARQASLSEVLRQMARVTGMQLEFVGPPPGTLVTLSLVDEPLAGAVARVLEGAGVDFAMSLDRTGERVVSLLLLGRAAVAASRPAPPRPVIRPLDTSGLEPELEEPDDETVPVPQPIEQILSPLTPNSPPQGALPPGAVAPNATTPTPAPTPPSGIPTYQPFNQPAAPPFGQRSPFVQPLPPPSAPPTGPQTPAPAPTPSPGTNPEN